MKPSTIISFLTGAFVGVVATAIYLSTDKGEETRVKIKNTLNDGMDAAKRGYESAKRVVKDFAEDVEDKIHTESSDIRRRARRASDAAKAAVEESLR
jgi:gas vesicle protein